MSDDLIKRSDAIKATWQEPTYTDPLNILTEVRDRIEAIPSADRPQGEWIEDPINKNNMYCSNCKVSYTKDFLRGMSLYHEPKDTPHFCPNCGADMRERKEGDR